MKDAIIKVMDKLDVKIKEEDTPQIREAAYLSTSLSPLINKLIIKEKDAALLVIASEQNKPLDSFEDLLKGIEKNYAN